MTVIALDGFSENRYRSLGCFFRRINYVESPIQRYRSEISAHFGCDYRHFGRSQSRPKFGLAVSAGGLFRPDSHAAAPLAQKEGTIRCRGDSRALDVRLSHGDGNRAHF